MPEIQSVHTSTKGTYTHHLNALTLGLSLILGLLNILSLIRLCWGVSPVETSDPKPSPLLHKDSGRLVTTNGICIGPSEGAGELVARLARSCAPSTLSIPISFLFTSEHFSTSFVASSSFLLRKENLLLMGVSSGVTVLEESAEPVYMHTYKHSN